MPTVADSAGGISYVAKHLAWSLAAYERMTITVFSHEGNRTLEPNSEKNLIDPWLSLSSEGESKPLSLKKIVTKELPTLIHSHGLWAYLNHQACKFAIEAKIPLIIHPHGMLDPWALKHKYWKKQLAMTLYQRHDLNISSLIVATSKDEYKNIRNLGFSQPIAIIPNGVQIDVTNSYSSSQVFSASESKQKTMLFLSRIHPVKGLLNLIAAWAKVRPKNWRLRIAGPDVNGHLAEVLDAADKYAISEFVDYVGEVYGERKEMVYQDADILVLPSFSENFGVVVPEALAHGVPVISTKGAPWMDLIKYECGWWVDIGVAPLANAIHQATSLTDDELNEMAYRGRLYATRYSWSSVAKQMGEVYNWVLKNGPRPDCVLLD